MRPSWYLKEQAFINILLPSCLDLKFPTLKIKTSGVFSLLTSDILAMLSEIVRQLYCISTTTDKVAMATQSPTETLEPQDQLMLSLEAVAEGTNQSVDRGGHLPLISKWSIIHRVCSKIYTVIKILIKVQYTYIKIYCMYVII